MERTERGNGSRPPVLRRSDPGAVSLRGGGLLEREACRCARCLESLGSRASWLSGFDVFRRIPVRVLVFVIGLAWGFGFCLRGVVLVIDAVDRFGRGASLLGFSMFGR